MRFKGKWTASFIVAAVLCSAGVNDDEAVVTGRGYPERNDDLAWENEFVAFRAYGPKTQRRGERGYGYDIFLKRGTRKPVLDMMYAYQLDPNDERTYHKDYGYGMDCYAVGPTLGAGVTALLEGDSLLYPWCYDKVDILRDGPRRFEARLTFAPAVVGGDTVTETRLISLDAGSRLNCTKVVYGGLKHPVELATGIVLHDEAGAVTTNPRWVSYVDPTQGPDNGKVFMGIVFAKQPSVTRRLDTVDGKSHVVGITRYNPGDTLTYYWGYAWDRTDITTLKQWHDYLDSFMSK